jgi:hypothetical protein
MDNQKTIKKPRIVNPELELLQAAIQVLTDYGVTAELIGTGAKAAATHVDAILNFELGGKRQKMLVEVKRWLTPATIGQVVAHLRELGDNTLLVTDYVTPQVAEKLKALDIAFVDTAGNAYLRRPPTLIWVTGRKLATTPARLKAGRAFQPMGLKLLFALLCRPDMVNVGVREIAKFAGVAHGTVGGVLADLRNLGFVVETGNQRTRVRKLRNRHKLLMQWAEAYARTLYPQHLIGRYQTNQPDWWKKLDTTRYQVLLGAEPAAAIATNYLRPGVVTLYVDEVPARMMVDFHIRKADEGNIELRRRFWPFDHAWEYPALTPPVLIYADLLATGDARCIETAQVFYDQYLARFFKED